jgi:hypothetical protein
MITESALVTELSYVKYVISNTVYIFKENVFFNIKLNHEILKWHVSSEISLYTVTVFAIRFEVQILVTRNLYMLSLVFA